MCEHDWRDTAEFVFEDAIEKELEELWASSCFLSHDLTGFIKNMSEIDESIADEGVVCCDLIHKEVIKYLDKEKENEAPDNTR